MASVKDAAREWVLRGTVENLPGHETTFSVSRNEVGDPNTFGEALRELRQQFGDNSGIAISSTEQQITITATPEAWTSWKTAIKAG